MTHQSNVLTNDFKNLLFFDAINLVDFKYEEAFWRSVKVFLTVYAGYDKLCTKLFERKLNEWMDSLKEIYPNIPKLDEKYLLENLLETKREVVKQQMAIIICIKKVRGLHLCTNLRVIFSIGQMSTGEKPLDMSTETQDMSVTLQCTFREFRRFRVRRRIIKITTIADSWVQTNEPLNEFSINFSEISAEGFEDWFYVGRGVRLLIKIIVSVFNEPGVDDIWLSDFTLHSIYLMLIIRCKDYDQQSKDYTTKHRTPTNKSKITYIRKRVNPKSETAFWTHFKSVDDIMQQIRSEIIEKRKQNYSQISDILSRRVKFVDLQISSYLNDDYEDIDPVCLCSEWCNWNAFGHYNPVFRQLMVCHNKLYMYDRTNIADIYIFCCSFVIHTVKQNKTSNIPSVLPQKAPVLPQKAPVLRLLNDANNMRELNYRIYYMRSQAYRDKYNNCVPSYYLLLGLSYKILRNSLTVHQIILDSSDDPFSDICSENLTFFYKVLNNLHLLIGDIPLFVARHDHRRWFCEMDDISRDEYCRYFLFAYRNRTDDKNPSYDYIFTEDLEYSSVLVKTDYQKLVKQITDRVHRFALPVNPFNIRVTIEPIIGAFVGIYKILHKVDVMLPKAAQRISMEHIFLCFQKLDEDLDNFVRNNKFIFFTDFEDTSRGPMDLQNCQKYYFFYTLKLYFIGYGIQRHFIRSLLEYNERFDSLHAKQVNHKFRFVFSLQQTIEEKYRRLYAEPLFDLPQGIAAAIDAFYFDFWGLADHENNPAVSLDGTITSAYFQYHRLCFWWKNDGNSKPKFVKILDVFYQMFEYIGSRSEELYNNILEYIETIQTYDYYLEVLDTLVYYLVKADCATIVCAVGSLFKELHRLQDPLLCRLRLSYSLTKPGWVPILRTMYEVFDCLDAHKNSYIVFDDQNNRISNTLTQTRSLIKNIYLSFYAKLSQEWLNEMSMLYQYIVANQTLNRLLPIHLASGLSFVTVFITDFRRYANHFRNECKKYFRKPVTQQHQRTLQFCGRAVDDYLQDYNAIERAEPFFANCWQAQIGYLIRNVNNMTEAQLKIDMIEADNYFTVI